jgi:basic membrane protein A and related proteins
MIDTVHAAPDCPDTTIVMLNVPGLEDAFDLAPNIVPVSHATDEGSFLAGAAAALRTETGVVGFVGGQPIHFIELFRAGFEAGVAHVDPDVQVLVTYVTDSPDFDDETVALEAYGNPAGGARAASELYRRDADVVYAVAGESGTGVLDAVTALSDPATPLWVIGVDTDWHLTEPPSRRRHVLGSMVIRIDTILVDLMQAYLDGELAPEPRRYGVAEGGIELRLGGTHPALTDALASLQQQLIDGEIHIPTPAP